MMIWFNTGLVEEEKARIHPADRGFSLGDGLFETLAVRQGRILRLAAHLARLRQGCFVLGIPFPTLDFATAFEAVLRVNALQNAALRLTVTRGVAPRGIVPPQHPNPTIVITAAPLPDIQNVAHCIITTLTRRNHHSPLSSLKTLAYLDNILALQDAMAQGRDEAIILNTSGCVAETSRSTIFVVIGGQLLTPPLKDGALPGIARAALLQTMPVTEKSLYPEDLYHAEEIFLTNSLGVRSVASVDAMPIKSPAQLLAPSVRIALTTDF